MTDVIGRLTTALADRYRVDDELGVGGMETVYRATDLKHDEDGLTITAQVASALDYA